MPTRSVQQRAGFRAEAFVDKAVSDGGHVWNTTLRDFGIDGHIRFVDASKQVSGFSVAAQVKGTEVGFSGKNESRFRFTCDADKIDYWMRCGQPVVLICVNLPQQQAWWKRVDTWFADPERRALWGQDLSVVRRRAQISAWSGRVRTCCRRCLFAVSGAIGRFNDMGEMSARARPGARRQVFAGQVAHR